MKKRYFGLLLLVVVGLLVAACAPPPEATEEPEPVAEETEAPVEEEMAAPEECAEENACVVIAPGDPIHLGFVGPMSGEVSAFGQDGSQGVLLVAAQAGEFEGHAYDISIEDSQGSADGGAAVANKYAADPTIVAVIGDLFSGATSGGQPIYEDARIPMVSPSATRIDLSQLGFTVFNRVVATDFYQGTVAANYMLNVLGATNVAITHDSSPYGQGLAERVRDVVEEGGGTVVAFEAVTAGESDYSAILTQLAAASPDVLFHGGYTGEAAVLASQKAAAGLGDVPFMSGDGIYGSQFIELAGDAGEGTYATSAVPPPETELRAAFDAAYEAEYGEPPGLLSSYSWFSADAFGVIDAAIRQVAIVGDDGTLYVPREALITAIRSTSGYEGITATITCDENGDCSEAGEAGFAAYIVEGGAWVEAPTE